MTNFKQYFRSHLKSKVKTLIYILSIVLALTYFWANASQESYYYNRELNVYELGYISTLYVPVIFMCILVYILPVMEFSFFKKRINLDCAYSLPISRKSMGAVHYLTGLIILFAAFTSSYLLNFILLLSRGPGWFNFAPMIGHYFLCLILGFAIYSIMVFVFNEANKRGDGIWFMILYTFVFLLVITTIVATTNDYSLYGTIIYFMPGLLFDAINTSYQSIVELTTTDRMVFWEKQEYIHLFVFWLMLGVASTVGFFLTFGNRRMEKTEEISDSYFGFRTLIPVYAISLMILLGASKSIILWVIIEILTLIGYTIYRRGFHYKKSDIAVMCLLLLFLFI